MKHEDAQLDEVFSALANSQRREMIYILALQPASVKQLAKHIGMSLPAIHRHIAILEQAELIQRKKVGRVNYLAISRSRLSLLQKWTSQYHTYWGSDNESLENYIAQIQRADET